MGWEKSLDRNQLIVNAISSNMLPFTFDDAAKKFVQSQEKVIFTFRVWGVNPRGDICVEVFNYDKRNDEPFNTLEFDEYQGQNIVAYLPKHNGEFIHGVEVTWIEFNDDSYDYGEDRTFNHGGFECQALSKDSTGLFFTQDEVISIFKKQLWLSYHARTYVEGVNGCHAAMNEMKQTTYSPKDLHEIIDVGLYAIAAFLGHLDED